MKTLSSLELRNHLGEVLDEVRVTGEPVVVVRHNRPLVRIVPYSPQGPEVLDTKKQKTADIVRKWPRRFHQIQPSLDLLSLVGGGEAISVEEEKGKIARYLSRRT